MRSFGIVDDKVAEAEFFLGLISNCKDFFQARCFSVAFAASTRSITFAMQASMRDLPGFDEWYSAKQTQLKTDPLAHFFHDFRRISHHIGDNAIGGGSFGEGWGHFYFTPIPDLQIVPEMDVVTASRAYFVTLLDIVFDCYIEFGPHIDPHQHYTAEHFSSMGKTIEDAEEELGFPRGWTDIDFPDQTFWRWHSLRNTVPRCGLHHAFHTYLKKQLPTEPTTPNIVLE